MNEHPFEETTLGKLLLLTAKIILPLLVLALLIVTPTFVPRRLWMNAYFLDLLARILVSALLIIIFWLVPDFEWKYKPQKRGWNTRFWLQLLRQGERFFQTGYAILSGLASLLVLGLSAWSFSAFLPASAFGRWLLAILFAAQTAILFILQYAPFYLKVKNPPEPNGTGPSMPERPATYRPPTRTSTARGVVITPRRRPDNEH